MQTEEVRAVCQRGIMTNARVLKTSIKSYQKRHHPKKHYVFLIDVQWSDGTTSTVRRSHDEFFIFQCRLMDRFKGRALPVFPGRKLIGRTNTRGVAEKRLPLLQRYLADIVAIGGPISQSDLLKKFLSPSLADFSATQLKQQASEDQESRESTPTRSGVEDGSDSDDNENYLSAVVGTCDYLPDADSTDQIAFKNGETLYVVNVVDCPNGYWQARNSNGEVGLVPCKHVTIDPDDMKKRMSLRAVRRLSLSAPKQSNKVLRRSFVSTECLVGSGSQMRRRGLFRPGRRHSCIMDADEVIVSVSDACPSSDENSVQSSNVSTPVVVRRAEGDIPDIVKSSQSSVKAVEESKANLSVVVEKEIQKSPSQVLKSDILNIFQGLDRLSSSDDLPTKLKSFGSELILNTQSSSDYLPTKLKSFGSELILNTQPTPPQLRSGVTSARRKLRKSKTESLLDCRSTDSDYSSASEGSRTIQSLGLIREVKIFVNTTDAADEVEGEAYKAVQKYKPIDRTGLPILKGDLLVVTLKLDDGWWCGRSCSSGQSGWFPSWVAKRA